MMESKICLFIFAAFILQIAFTRDPQFSKLSTIDEIKAYVIRFGHSSNNNTNTADAISEGIKSLQKYGGIPETGRIDDETLNLLNTPRCQLPDKRHPTNKRNKRYVALNKWSRTSLSYRLTNSPKTVIGITSSNLLPILQTSLQDWAAVTPLKFTNQANANQFSDITLGFYSSDHGDGYPFDGPGKTLAHAFFPEDGRLHFDNDETWSQGTTAGISLRQTATHELGHILGLDHSTVKSAVMYAYYSGYTASFKLDPDDISGIQSLYGPFVAETTTKSTPTTTISATFPPTPTSPTPTTTTTTTTKIALTTSVATPAATGLETNFNLNTVSQNQFTNFVDPTGTVFGSVGPNFYTAFTLFTPNFGFTVSNAFVTGSPFQSPAQGTSFLAAGTVATQSFFGTTFAPILQFGSTNWIRQLAIGTKA